jgi:hypothetical protein
MAILGAVRILQCLTTGKAPVTALSDNGLSVSRFSYLFAYSTVKGLVATN